MTRIEDLYLNNSQILVVDDNPGSLKLLSGILSESGYQVRPALNGNLALRSAEMEPPDLVILDIVMPEISGYDVCRQLKASPLNRDIPVIFISSLEDSADKVKGFEAGGVDFITKPYQSQEVLARVKTHLTLQNLQKKLKEQNSLLMDEITERERTEEELLLYQTNLEEMVKKRTGELNQFFSLHLDLLSISNANGYFVTLNPEWERTLGYSLNELMAKPIIEFIHPDDRENTLRITTLAKSDDIIHYINRYQRKDGTFRWLEWSSSPFDERIYAAARDITDRIHMEEERKKLLEQIQKNIAELSLLNDGIRNPLTIILSVVETLEEQKRTIIVRETERIDAMITNLDHRWIESEKIFSFLKKHYHIDYQK